MVQIAFRIIEQKIINEENDRHEIYFHDDLFISQNQENRDVDSNLDFSQGDDLNDRWRVETDVWDTDDIWHEDYQRLFFGKIKSSIKPEDIPEIELDCPRIQGEEKNEMFDDVSEEIFNETEEYLDTQLKNYFRITL